MEKRNCSGDLGYCEHVGHTAAVILTWSDNTVVDVDCSYQTCGHASQCEFYQRHPIGFCQTYPLAENREKPQSLDL